MVTNNTDCAWPTDEKENLLEAYDFLTDLQE